MPPAYPAPSPTGRRSATVVLTRASSRRNRSGAVVRVSGAMSTPSLTAKPGMRRSKCRSLDQSTDQGLRKHLAKVRGRHPARVGGPWEVAARPARKQVGHELCRRTVLPAANLEGLLLDGILEPGPGKGIRAWVVLWTHLYDHRAVCPERLPLRAAIPLTTTRLAWFVAETTVPRDTCRTYVQDERDFALVAVRSVDTKPVAIHPAPLRTSLHPRVAACSMRAPT